MKRLILAAMLCLIASTVPSSAGGAEQVGTTFPKRFPVILDASLGVPVLGFGGAGPAKRTPVIFLHGNNDTPYPTDCNTTYGKVQAFAQYFADHGYRLGELWALGYQGDQCDLQTDQSKRAAFPHTTAANVPDLRRFVKAVLRYTGARRVDIVGHSYGTTLAREWMRQDRTWRFVRRLVGIDGPEHGIINCSPGPRNYYVTIGFSPDSAVCREVGSDRTPFLRRLNRGEETPGPTRYLTVANADTSFVYIDEQDGVFPPVPSEDREGKPHDFSRSAWMKGSKIVLMTGQGAYDDSLRTSHLGILNSPEVWKLTYDYLSRR
jgi:pimeloyl-ACP methyl ester carboxylesterase